MLDSMKGTLNVAMGLTKQICTPRALAKRAIKSVITDVVVCVIVTIIMVGGAMIYTITTDNKKK